MRTAIGQNSDKDSVRLSIHWDMQKESRTEFSINSRYYHSYHDSPGSTDNPTPDARQRYQKGAFDFTAKGIMGEKSEFSIKSYADITGLDDLSQTGIVSKLDVYKIGIKTDTSWAEDDGKWALRIGGIIEQDSVDHNFTGDHHRDSASLSAQFDCKFGDFVISFGLRGDYTNYFNFLPASTTGISYAISKKCLLKSNVGYMENSRHLRSSISPATVLLTR